MYIKGNLNGLDLFSGIGGLTLALRDWVKPISYCEIDPFCQAVLLSRMRTNDLPEAPIWDDICKFNGRQFWEHIDIIYGGFPCQDISCAGNGKGLEGKRSGLFFEIVRLAKEIKPAFIFLENVPAITTRGGLRVVREITEMGYDCRWCIISAQSIGAVHKRERWFMLAHAKHNGIASYPHRQGLAKLVESWGQQQHTEMLRETKRASGVSMHAADCDTNSKPSEQANKNPESYKNKQDSRGRFTRLYWPLESVGHWQETVSTMGKCTNGLPNQVDRLRALGNAVVPEQARQAFKHLMGI